MPIYAYRCSACGHAKDVLQKMSAPVLTLCPACGQDSFVKQVTAAGFQLKGSGWYVTDFRDGAKAKTAGAGKDDTKSTETASGADAEKSPAKASDKASDKASGKAAGADKPATPSADKPASSASSGTTKTSTDATKSAASKPATPGRGS